MSVTGHIIGNWNLTGEVSDSGGTNVVPNPPEEATDSLEKVAIDDVVYSITGEQEQADWDQADPTAVDYIKNKPTIPAAQVNSDWDAASGVAEILNKPTLSTVATSGDYDDLINKPTIPAAQINSDWNAASGVAQILNKPTIPAAQVNSDWNAASGVAQILNKPTIPAAQVNSDWNAASGVAQILNKPTIPAAQVNSDWDAASGVAQILNKPTLSAVATSGDASDVSYDNSVSGMTATDVQAAVDELKSNLTDLKTLEFRSYVIGGNYQKDEYNIICVYNEHLKHVQIDAYPRTDDGSGTVTRGNYVLARIPFIPRYTTYIPINRTDYANVCAVLKIRKTEYNGQDIGEISVELLDGNTPKGVQLCTHLEFYYDDDSIIPSQS